MGDVVEIEIGDDVGILQGDVIDGLMVLGDNVIDCVVTSPPYWGLRDYGVAGQIGLEATPEEFVARMIEVFDQVRRVLKPTGTLWLNLGDSYMGGGRGGGSENCKQRTNEGSLALVPTGRHSTIKKGDMVGIPWRVAFALQAAGWWLRQDIIWHKPNPMPESVTSRCTKAHEYVFLLSKSAKYHFDAEAIREPLSGNYPPNHKRNVLTEASHAPGASPHSGIRKSGNGFAGRQGGASYQVVGGGGGTEEVWEEPPDGKRNCRDVWTITNKPYKGAHFATFPPDLAERCIKAGCPEGGVVLDPFMGSGTTAMVARRLGRRAIGCELNPEYVGLIRQRLASEPERAAVVGALIGVELFRQGRVSFDPTNGYRLCES